MIAIQNNRNRERGSRRHNVLSRSTTSMYNVIKGKIPRGLNGGVRVILNNRENTIPYVDPETKKMVKTKQGDILVKDFTYLTFKKEGKTVAPESDIKKQLMGWIASNVPKTKLTRDMISTDSGDVMGDFDGVKNYISQSARQILLGAQMLHLHYSSLMSISTKLVYKQYLQRYCLTATTPI